MEEVQLLVVTEDFIACPDEETSGGLDDEDASGVKDRSIAGIVEVLHQLREIN